MFQDQQFLNELHELPSDRQAEVLDFIRALKRKQEAQSQAIQPRFGSARGLISMSADFDEPLEDFAEYM
jgi:transcriptional regulator with AAA-type ATPase domain